MQLLYKDSYFNNPFSPNYAIWRIAEFSKIVSITGWENFVFILDSFLCMIIYFILFTKQLILCG